MQKSTIDEEEVAKFSKLARWWWDESGEFRMLHQINPIRLSYIRDKITEHFGEFKGLTIIDIGCGGGLVSEPLARMGAKITAIDASIENIKTAECHAKQENLNIEYICTSAEEHNGKYDVVLCLEIIEHVYDAQMFIDAASRLMKDDGIMIISTINRTVTSYLEAILAAEYILSLVPKGTHEFSKFLKPSEIATMIRKHNLHIQEAIGFGIDLPSRNWKLRKNIDVNYLVTIKRG